MMEQILKLLRAAEWHLVSYGGGSDTGEVVVRKGNKDYQIIVRAVEPHVHVR